jgi:predicted MFS family arabinose efflux permease
MKSRNIPILAIAQALNMSGPPAIVLLGGIVGTELAPSPALATLPISLMVVGVALAAIPAALLMRRIGRRKGFMLAAGLAATGALLSAWALVQGSFVFFCLGTVLVGANGAFVQQYRFAAAESVDPSFAGRAVSFVLVGGIFAGYLGPEIAQRTQTLLGNALFVGSFVSVAALYVIAIGLLSFLRDVAPPSAIDYGAGRPLAEIARQPNYLVAVLAGAASYGVMSFIMTATPVHMVGGEGFSLDQTTLVIQSHIMAMYIPSLITGFLLERLGLYRIMVLGAILMIACAGVAIVSAELIHFWGALVLLGLGWNLLFVGGTVLLTRTYAPTERIHGIWRAGAGFFVRRHYAVHHQLDGHEPAGHSGADGCPGGCAAAAAGTGGGGGINSPGNYSGYSTCPSKSRLVI